MTDTKTNHHITVCIPAYEMHGAGPDFLRHSFDVLLTQTFTDFDVVVSDNSIDQSIKKVCDAYANRLPITYVKNTTGNDLCNNTNNALKHGTGKILKILFQDDFLYDENSLRILADNFDLTHDHWLMTACMHTEDGKVFFRTHHPKYHSHVHYGWNTLGTPSIMAVKNEPGMAFFDDRFKWTLNDCDYYKENFDRFGLPKILTDVTVVIRWHPGSLTNTKATIKARIDEFNAMLKKRGETIFSHPAIFKIWIKTRLKKIKSIISK